MSDRWNGYPPDGTPPDSFHWLITDAGNPPVPCQWIWLYWRRLGTSEITRPDLAAAMSWRYVGPCVPPRGVWDED